MAKALYRKYRSRSLNEVLGQAHVTDVLTRSLEAGHIAHAYLLTGPRGVGKTSIARILAHEINKLPYSQDSSHLDIIEIDAASNNGVEDVRDLRDKVQITPVSSAKKVYIIDEVHMLSKAAFNALLKTLEEPPEHVVFILATTDADKLPDTIISRTQRFTFRTIASETIMAHLKKIANDEKIKINDEALELIAQRGDGSFRDSISLLDQLRSLANEQQEITREQVEQSLGLAPIEHVEQLLAAYESKNLAKIVELLHDSDNSHIPAELLANQLTQIIHKQIANKPQLIELLDKLLDVPKSSQPNLKLLTVLAAHAKPQPKSAALQAPVPEVKATVRELRSPLPSNKKTVAAQLKQVNNTPAPTQAPQIETAPKNTSSSQPLTLDWQKLIDYIHEHFVAVYSVLSKCSHETKDDTLIIYTGNAFYKKKLDEPARRINLMKSLEAIGAGQPQIETIPTAAPPKDSQAAAVAAIMGGGEEVAVDAS